MQYVEFISWSMNNRCTAQLAIQYTHSFKYLDVYVLEKIEFIKHNKIHIFVLGLLSNPMIPPFKKVITAFNYNGIYILICLII